MRALFFGTYDAKRHPRIQVVKEGLGDLGFEVVECNVPLGISTEGRVAMANRPWLAFLLLGRLVASWARLIRLARSVSAPDVVVVGYLGHLDVLLARALWRGRRIVLDHLVPLGEAVQDRRVSSERVKWLMERLDRAALGAGDVLCVDTQAHLETLPEDARRKAVVVRVGATRSWFIEPVPREDGHLRVIFFGLYTPLQGAPVIGRAIRLLEEEPIRFTMVGTGQDYAHTRELAGSRAAVDWLEWVDMERLPRAVAEHDVCLGIFGVTEKANRVVPNKVYQGAAAGSAIVTADTPPQREILGDAALLVPAGDAAALAAALVRLSQNRAELWRYRLAAHQRAREAFEPSVVARPLRDYLRGEGSELGDDQAATPASEER